MNQAVILHGSNGSPKKHWYPWLKKQLEKKEYKTKTPKFNTQKETLKQWEKTFNKEIGNIEGKTIIGHSLGAVLALNILQKQGTAKKTILVSGFTGKAQENQPENYSTFSEKNFQWGKIRNNSQQFKIIHSKNDPYVPLKKGLELSNQLKCEIEIIENGGHFLEKDGYKKFPKLLETVLN